MYYNVDDKHAAIKEVQKFLSYISQENDEYPHITIDGYYSAETADAVRIFQREQKLEQSGTVNKETFDALFRQYTEYLIKKESLNSVFDESSFPLKLGSFGNDVTNLNAMISELSIYYRDIESTYGDFFGNETDNNVRLLQKYFDMEVDGTVSTVMMKRLMDEINIRKNFGNG